jgi:hypothetical protein
MVTRREDYSCVRAELRSRLGRHKIPPEFSVRLVAHVLPHV